MPIHRTGPTPSFLEYIKGYLLIPYNRPLTFIPMGQYHWIDIPNFQRGLSWTISEIEDLINTNSNLLGNIILANFQLHTNSKISYVFDNIPEIQNNLVPKPTDYSVLIDGLQRFSVGTLLMKIILDFIEVNPNTYERWFPNIASQRTILTPYVAHNHDLLINYPRTVLKESYKDLYDKVEHFLKKELNSTTGMNLASKLEELFINKQIAIDIFYGFSSLQDALATFIGLNTTRVELGPVDILRAYIIDEAVRSGWSDSQIETFENDFTDIFIENEKPKSSILPLVNVFVRIVQSGNGSKIFSTWGSNTLDIDEVYRLLEFVKIMEGLNNPYLKEIKLIGSAPYSLVLGYFYHEVIKRNIFYKNDPNFEGNVKNLINSKELHAFLCASLRLLLEGKIGRISPYIEKIFLDVSYTNFNLYDISNKILQDFLNSDLSGPVDKIWLQKSLNKVKKKVAPRIFNAMLLPVLPNNRTLNDFGGSFNPLLFGSRVQFFQVDHLIPASMLDNRIPGFDEGHTLRNFAPLRGDLNRQAKATPCSQKLKPNGIYDVNNRHHPYIEWLVDVHYNKYKTNPRDLDNQEKLIYRASPPIGDERIEYITNQLLSRL